MKIDWVKNVFSDGNHNAFTGLTRFRDSYYLAFRSAPGHVSDEAEQVIMASPNGQDWTIFSRQNFSSLWGNPIDYRDSSFLATDERLLLYSFCTPVINGERQRSFTQAQILSDQNETWSSPKIVHAETRLWKPTRINNRFYAIGYHRDANGVLTAYFHQSIDGFHWKPTGRVGAGSEACLFSPKPNRIQVFLRTETPPYHLEVLEGEFPFEIWTKRFESNVIIQCPHVETWRGRLLLIGRERPDYMKTANLKQPSFSQHRTKIWELSNNTFTELLELPSAGDTAYAGTAFTPEGDLLVSYYSRHETELANAWRDIMPANVYVAKISENDRENPETSLPQ